MKFYIIKTIFLIALLVSPSLIQAQEDDHEHVQGKVTDAESGAELIGAALVVTGTATGTTTDVNGKFELHLSDLPVKLAVSYIGYQRDTVTVTKANAASVNIKLKLASGLLDSFEVVEEATGTFISTMDPIITENITTDELESAACCNLSESFETNASVDVVVADAVSGTKKIRMLGLDGVYTQLQIENLQAIRGLAAATGLTQIPGTWVKSIQINKGAGTVINGYESMTGQINLEFMKPEKTDKLFLNAYANSAGRGELNAQYASKVAEKWGTNLFFHVSGAERLNDRNKDGFLDIPVYHNINFFNRWKYANGDKRMQIMLRVVDEARRSGQTDFSYDRDFGQQTAYGIGINSRQYELFVKRGWLMSDHPGRSFAILAKANRFELDTYFGNREYAGIQHSANFRAVFVDKLGTTLSKYSTGVSLNFDQFDERFIDSTFKRDEIVPGAFFEYTYDNKENFSTVLGVRGDYHNLFGFRASPRAHLKWNPKPLTAFRLSGGYGWRTPNAFADNLGVLASSRQVVVEADLKPESAWNFGASFQRKFSIRTDDASFTIDFFRTEFENQLVMDLDRTARQVVFYNLDGQSFANAAQAEFAFSPIERIGVKMAYKYTEVRVTYDGTLMDRPLVPKHRALFNVGYESPKKIWRVDATTNFFGASRLPGTEENSVANQRPGQTLNYITQHLQITKEFRWFEVYLGSENLFDYRQDQPIVSVEDPFGSEFDATMIWAPINGRMVYAGLRYKIR